MNALQNENRHVFASWPASLKTLACAVLVSSFTLSQNAVALVTTPTTPPLTPEQMEMVNAAIDRLFSQVETAIPEAVQATEVTEQESPPLLGAILLGTLGSVYAGVKTRQAWENLKADHRSHLPEGWQMLIDPDPAALAYSDCLKGLRVCYVLQPNGQFVSWDLNSPSAGPREVIEKLKRFHQSMREQVQRMLDENSYWQHIRNGEIDPNMDLLTWLARGKPLLNTPFGGTHSSAAIEEWRRVESQPKFLTAQKFGTTIYFLASADHREGVPEIPNDTKAVVLALGGSGSARGNGSAFMRNAQSMPNGVAMVSMDYPFHGRGPQDRRYEDADTFLGMITGAIDYYKQRGLPVFLLGHSFGCYVIQEILSRQPDLIQGAIMLSPGGNQIPGLLAHYEAFRFSPEWDRFINEHHIVMAASADRWAEGMDGSGGMGGRFSSGRSTDPIPTHAPVVVVRGENDPWSTSDLARAIAARFENGTFVELEGEDHVSVLKAEVKNKSFIAQKMAQMIESTTSVRLPTSKRKTSAAEKLIAFSEHSGLFRRYLIRAGISDVATVTEDQAAIILKRWTDDHSQGILVLARERIALLQYYGVYRALDYIDAHPEATAMDLFKAVNEEIILFGPELDEDRAWDVFGGPGLLSLTPEKRLATEKFLRAVREISEKPADQITQQERSKLVDLVIAPLRYRVRTTYNQILAFNRYIALGTQSFLPTE